MDTKMLLYFLAGLAFALFLLPLIQGWFAKRSANVGG